MKAIVLYYSATGNTAKIANAIHKGMETELEVCDIASIRKADPEEMAKYDLIVVGGPIWYYRETANLRDFIYKMPDMKGKLCVMFCTHGSAPARYMFTLSTIVKKKGMTIIGWGNWYGSVYQVLHMPKPYMTDGHPDEISLKQAEDFGREMADRAKRVAQGEEGLIPKPGTGNYAGAEALWKTKLAGPPPEEEAKPGAPPPRARPLRPETVRTFNTEKCKYPDCGKCIDICPIDAISYSEGKMTIRKDSCINCALCDKMCPEEAIEINEEAMMIRTQHRIDVEKCAYPECTLCADYCTMQCIDLTQTPPVFKKSCEGDDLCWVICPNNAIEILNIDTTHGPMAPTTREDIENHGFVKNLAEEEKKGNFRRHVPIDEIGINNIIYKSTNAPRFVIDHEEP